MSRPIHFWAECTSPTCGATFSATYDSGDGGYGLWYVCFACGAVDSVRKPRGCCGKPMHAWRFDDCPLCRTPIQATERLGHAY